MRNRGNAYATGPPVKRVPSGSTAQVASAAHLSSYTTSPSGLRRTGPWLPVGTPSVTVAAINFLVASGQARRLDEIAKRLAFLAAEAEGEVVAEVRAPLDLDADQIDRLSAALSKATGKRIQVKVIVDPSVIGGVVTKVGDTVLDGSVQNRFNELREQWG